MKKFITFILTINLVMSIAFAQAGSVAFALAVEVSPAERALMLAEQELKKAKEAYDQALSDYNEFVENNAEYAAAEALVKEKKEAAEKAQSAKDEAERAKNQADEAVAAAQSEFDAASAAVTAAEQAVNTAQDEVNDAEKNLTQAKKDKATAEEELTKAQEDKAKAEKEKEDAEKALADYRSQASQSQELNAYTFFDWLSNKSDQTQAVRDSAAVAKRMLKNEITSADGAAIKNNGSVSGGSSSKTYEQIIGYTNIGGEIDATNWNNFKYAIEMAEKGNTCRAKENLSPLKISSVMMAMGEINANYQANLPMDIDHASAFKSLENLAVRWSYSKGYNPYDGWYTEEKKNYEENNGGQTGHYLTLTDRNSGLQMKTTGMGYVCYNDSGYPKTEKFSQTFGWSSCYANGNDGISVADYLALVNEFEQSAGTSGGSEDELLQAVTDAETAITNAQNAINIATNKVNTATERARQCEEALNAAKNNLTEKKTALTEKQTDKFDTNTALSDAKAEQSKKAAELSTAQSNLDSANKAKDSAEKTLKELIEASADLAPLKEALDAAKEKLEAATEARDAAQKALDEERAQKEEQLLKFREEERKRQEEEERKRREEAEKERLEELEWNGTQSAKIPTVKSVKFKPAKKKVTVSWKKVTAKNLKKFDKVEVQVCPNKKFQRADTKRIEVSKKKKSTTVKGLTKGKTYYVRVRNVKGSGTDKNVSKWSKVKKVKIKK